MSTIDSENPAWMSRSFALLKSHGMFRRTEEKQDCGRHTPVHAHQQLSASPISSPPRTASPTLRATWHARNGDGQGTRQLRGTISLTSSASLTSACLSLPNCSISDRDRLVYRSTASTKSLRTYLRMANSLDPGTRYSSSS